MQEITLTLSNKLGLHARPAALFVERANQFKCDIRVLSPARDVEVNGKSILGVLSLDAVHGTVITLRAEGEDAPEALAGLLDLIDTKLGSGDDRL